MSLEITTLEKHLASTNELLATYNNVGSRRKEAKAQLSTLEDKETALIVDYDGCKAAVNGKGKLVSYNKDANKHIVHAKVRGLQGAAPGNKKLGEVVIPCGVCAIVGSGNTGKSPLAHALASYGGENYAVVRVGEPLSGYGSSKTESAEDLAQAMVLASDVVVDSIKDVLSSGSGAAMKSGLNRDALTSISTWSAQACDLGTTLYIPINPSTPEPAVVAMIAEAAKSNATSCLIHAGGQKWEFFARTGEGLQRVHAYLTFDSKGTITIDVDRDDVVSEKVEGRIEKLVINQVSNFNDAIGRLIQG